MSLIILLYLVCYPFDSQFFAIKVKLSFPVQQHSGFELIKEVWNFDKVILIYCFGTSFCAIATIEDVKDESTQFEIFPT